MKESLATWVQKIEPIDVLKWTGVAFAVYVEIIAAIWLAFSLTEWVS